ncbi:MULTISPECIES: winged helix-turn-helix domain-containing protein [unclassified Saccharibacter]|uniref:winged helix-turn-helix domain-containing protein n=1 Tax=unclassified Saccharibacter TaxID=2648722 RepID=UPI0013293795|nr:MULTISPECIES: winged helix-turn-helix domain-containing protein [unclassified Saccharibacter]MXV35801.1 hypothetical protein [Saccharibacter sp. EH611]MXV57922.1 hypothetical protein [Saccharibacter sp. EH70]MXV66317.1 hypothetical protein [Saccharibacter sp. EH60]
MRLIFGNLELDADTQILTSPRGSIRLSHNDYRVMSSLMRRGNKITTMDSLISEVWAHPREEPDYAEDAVRDCIKNLRGFIGLSALGRHTIKSERGCGYYLDDKRPEKTRRITRHERNRRQDEQGHARVPRHSGKMRQYFLSI